MLLWARLIVFCTLTTVGDVMRKKKTTDAGIADVSGRLTLLDIRLLHVKCGLELPGFSPPLDLKAEVTNVTYGKTDGHVLYEISYALEAHNMLKKLAWASEYTFLLAYKLDGAISDDEMAAFVPSMYRCAHPYLTEFTHSLTLSMGLPPLVLEIFKPSK